MVTAASQRRSGEGRHRFVQQTLTSASQVPNTDILPRGYDVCRRMTKNGCKLCTGGVYKDRGK